MKRIGALLLGSFVFLCALFAAGCTDTTELQQQIDELKASQAEIQALKDEINSLKSQIDTNNQELQDQLNQATAKLATLEGKINGEPIEYLNEEDTVTFVNNGIKLFDIQVMKGIQRADVSTVDFNLTSPLISDDPLTLFDINAYIYNPKTNKIEIQYAKGPNSTIDNVDYFGDYSVVFSPDEENSYLTYFFSGTILIAAYNINFIRK